MVKVRRIRRRIKKTTENEEGRKREREGGKVMVKGRKSKQEKK